MQDSVAGAGAVASPTHSLDPLTPDEIRRAAAIVRGGHRNTRILVRQSVRAMRATLPVHLTIPLQCSAYPHATSAALS